MFNLLLLIHLRQTFIDVFCNYFNNLLAMQLINKITFRVLQLAPRSLVKIFSKRYIAGFNFKETLSICKKLNQKGFCLTLDILGEHTSSLKESKSITLQYKKLLKTIRDYNIDANISVKPTHIGLDQGCNVFKENLEDLARTALEHSNFIRIDMESSQTTDDTINTYNKISKEYKNIGIVLQAYMHRTFDDISKIPPNSLNFRLCKGIYKEPSNIAIQDRKKINKNYLKILDYALSNKIYIGIATHDNYLMRESCKLIEKYEASTECFEFQALYGVPMDYWHQKNLSNGYKVRLYLPFGDNWYDYSLRRIKENPDIAKYVIKNLFK